MDTGKALQSIPTSCVQYMYDRNGSNNPNKLGTDLEQSTDIGIKSSKVEPDGTLNIPIGNYTTYLILNRKYQGINTCEGSEYHDLDPRPDSKNTYCTNNKWAGAKKACADAGFVLPDMNSMGKLYCRAKGTSGYYDYMNNNRRISCDTSKIDSTLVTKLTEKNASLTGEYHTSTTNSGGYAYILNFYNGDLRPYAHFASFSESVVCLGTNTN